MNFCLDLQAESGSLETVEGIDLDRSSNELQVTAELRISDAPLASPDLSTLSGSSESSLVQTQSSDSVAAGLLTPSPEREDEDGEETEEVTETEATVTEGESEDETESESITLHDDLMKDTDSVTTTESGATVVDTLTMATDSEMVAPPDSNGEVRQGEESVKSIAAKLAEHPSLVNSSESIKTDTHNHVHDQNEEVVVSGNKHEQVVEWEEEDKKLPPVEGTSESSDTDSVNTTPSDSPAKARLDGVVLRPPSLNRAKNTGKFEKIFEHMNSCEFVESFWGLFFSKSLNFKALVNISVLLK